MKQNKRQKDIKRESMNVKTAGVANMAMFWSKDKERHGASHFGQALVCISHAGDFARGTSLVLSSTHLDRLVYAYAILEILRVHVCC